MINDAMYNISKSFLSQAQKVQTSGFHDVEDLYEE